MGTDVYVGQVRPSQLLWAYGPGALIDLPNLSVITMGLDSWRENNCTQIKEPRLLNAIRRILGPQVKELRMPPVQLEEQIDLHSAEAFIGVPVRPFPRWLRCTRCGLLAEYDSGLFEIKENPWHPEQTHFIHKGCRYGNNVDAVPSRFLFACRNGHVDDFPWRWFVHQGPSNCTKTLYLQEINDALQLDSLVVKCDCGAKMSMTLAFGPNSKRFLPGCRGRHPHLNKFEDCDEEPQTILLSASNLWFPHTVSVLAIPTEENVLKQLITNGWDLFQDCVSEEETKSVLKTIIKAHLLPGIEQYDAKAVWSAIEDKKASAGKPVCVTEEDIKVPEWEMLKSPTPVSQWPQFHATRTDIPQKYADKICDVLLLERLRKVNALIGYSRLEGTDETIAPEEQVPRAPLSKEPPFWVPACEVHGEGIFIRFNEEAVAEWENNDAVREREKVLLKGYQGWRTSHRLQADKGFPGVRYVMLHTLAHLIIREFALECGYNATSIQERIYAKNDGKVQMAGILLYTAASDSDGTLGGLVELGKSDSLERILTLALRRAAVCSSDPLCSLHNPSEDRSLHAAACFVAETSCEACNRYLDRALVIKTFECQDVAFFASEE